MSCCLAVNSDVLFMGFDGSYFFLKFRDLFSGNNALSFSIQGTVLQGGFSFGFPNKPLAFYPLKYLNLNQEIFYTPVLIYIYALLIIYVVGWTSGTSFRFSDRQKHFFSSLLCVFLTPVSWPTLYYPLAYLSPNFVIAPMLTLLTVAKLSTIQKSNFKVLITRISLSLGWVLVTISNVIGSYLLLTVIGLILAIQIIFSENRRKRLITIFIVLGPSFFLSTVLHIPMTLSSGAFNNRSTLGELSMSNLSSISELLFGNYSTFSVASPMIGIFILLSIWFISRYSVRIEHRQLVYGALAWLLFIVLGLTVRQVNAHYVGPSFRDFEYQFFPILLATIICATGLIKTSARKSINKSSHVWNIVLVAILSLVLSFSVIDTRVPILNGSKKNEWRATTSLPPTRPSFFEDLNLSISKKNSTFRGTLLTIGPTDSDGVSTWGLQSRADGEIWKESGSDPRSIGAWWAGIPTVFSYSQVYTNTYFQKATEFFAKSSNIQTRNVVVLTEINRSGLDYFGVTSVLSYAPIIGSVQSDLVFRKRYKFNSESIFLYQRLTNRSKNFSTQNSNYLNLKINVNENQLQISFAYDSITGRHLILPFIHHECWKTSENLGLTSVSRAHDGRLQVWSRENSPIKISLLLSPFKDPLCGWREYFNNR